MRRPSSPGPWSWPPCAGSPGRWRPSGPAVADRRRAHPPGQGPRHPRLRPDRRHRRRLRHGLRHGVVAWGARARSTGPGRPVCGWRRPGGALRRVRRGVPPPPPGGGHPGDRHRRRPGPDATRRPARQHQPGRAHRARGAGGRPRCGPAGHGRRRRLRARAAHRPRRPAAPAGERGGHAPPGLRDRRGVGAPVRRRLRPDQRLRRRGPHPRGQPRGAGSRPPGRGPEPSGQAATFRAKLGEALGPAGLHARKVLRCLGSLGKHLGRQGEPGALPLGVSVTVRSTSKSGWPSSSIGVVTSTSRSGRTSSGNTPVIGYVTPSGAVMSMRIAPPGRASTSQRGMVNRSGHHHSDTWAESVHASHTSSGGASSRSARGGGRCCVRCRS